MEIRAVELTMHEWFVSGHDFSRAEKLLFTWASARVACNGASRESDNIGTKNLNTDPRQAGTDNIEETDQHRYLGGVEKLAANGRE